MADGKVIAGLTSTESEIRFIGSLFLNNDLFLEYEKVIDKKDEHGTATGTTVIINIKEELS